MSTSETPERDTMTRSDRWSIIATIIGTGTAILAVMGILASGFMSQAATDRATMQATLEAFRAEAAADRRAMQAEATADRRAMQAEATADRRAMQASLDAFRTELQRIAERQARLEGPLLADMPADNGLPGLPPG